MHSFSLRTNRVPPVQPRSPVRGGATVQLTHASLRMRVHRRIHPRDLTCSLAVTARRGMSWHPQDIVARSIVPLLRKFVEGYNVAVITFGSSGSGKTTVLEGSKVRGGMQQAWASLPYPNLEYTPMARA